MVPASTPEPSATPEAFSLNRYSIVRRQGRPRWYVRDGEREVGFVKRSSWKGALDVLAGQRSDERLLRIEPMFVMASNDQRKYCVLHHDGAPIGVATGLGELFDTDEHQLATMTNYTVVPVKGGRLRRFLLRGYHGWTQELAQTDGGESARLELLDRLRGRLEVTIPPACSLDRRLIFAVALLTQADYRGSGGEISASGGP